MPIDWTRVTVDHIRQACDLYDACSAVPKRPARRTFLLFNGRSYPAKFIRGLAYRIATGIELDPIKDFTGGDDTARFFANLGFQTSAKSTPTMTPPPSVSQPTPVAQVAAPPTQRKYEPQKQALFDLLKKRFGTVDCEAQFAWLVVPRFEELKEPLARILQALQAMRGLSDFAGAGRSLRCDFCIPAERLIVEYDERQHFTLQRAKALELYPADVPLEFDHQEWIKTCNSIKATDPSPPHRDEQRAFYDSLRDIFAAQNGYRLIRFRQGDFDWTGQEAEEKLAAVLSTSSVSRRPTGQVASEIRKLALVSHDYNVPDSQGLYDYSEHFARINKLCDDHGCDTILYALYGPLTKVQRVILEVGQPAIGSFDHVEVWLREQETPVLAYQRFATSTSPPTDKQKFLDDLESRQVSTALLMICGETNIASLVRGSDEFHDPFGFADRLRDLKTRVVLNPIHDYMRRYEMREKRRFYSQCARTVISVWNKGKGKEAWVPWTVFHNGEERTDRVREIERPFIDRPDIRIGVLELDSEEFNPSP